MKNIKWNILSGSALKIIALLTMLIDHTALILLSQMGWAQQAVLGDFTFYYILRRIGRISFPIFCFLLVEGFVHTRNTKKYALSLMIFALVSEVPFDLMVSGKYWFADKQNIFFTLFLGVLLMWVIKKADKPQLKILYLAGVCLLASVMHTDYGLGGVLLIGLMYVLREQKILKALFAFPFLSGGVYALCAFIPISMYNGERGFVHGKVMKYAFYVFYPLHILVLLWIKYNVL